MINPWLQIPFEDYENHMKDENVNQYEILNLITKDFLEKTKPEIFVILGCATGNGLEHIDNEITEIIHAIDINSSYLQILTQRFGKLINGLETHEIDISKNIEGICNANLIIGALIFEYVIVERAIKNIKKMIAVNGLFVAVIQKSDKYEFVSDTPYKSLHLLDNISSEINENDFVNICERNGLGLVAKEVKGLNSGKSFIVVSFINKK